MEVLKYKDIVLRQEDLDSLRENVYLNDQLIGFYFTYLSSLFGSDEILLLPPSVSFWLTNDEDHLSVRKSLEELEVDGKNIIFFPIIDCGDLGGEEEGAHWSLLVYDRSMNEFIHHDSMEGVNNPYAVKLYEAVKEFMGAAGESLFTSSSSKKPSLRGKPSKKKDAQPLKKVPSAPASALPVFRECNTPQQTNGVDCGLYLMAIARAICQWHASKSKTNTKNWFSYLEKNVDSSYVEFKMRSELRKLIEDLRLEQ